MEAVAWTEENSIMNVKTGNLFDPSANATRAKVAHGLMNCFSEGIVPEIIRTEENQATEPEV